MQRVGFVILNICKDHGHKMNVFICQKNEADFMMKCTSMQNSKCF